ncbi:hypothetical protein G9P44_003169 [Scheffersomyces stipitis]|nr:hypothetical protein G9P44_003169 [Scheffersomyces stipitis]
MKLLSLHIVAFLSSLFHPPPFELNHVNNGVCFYVEKPQTLRLSLDRSEGSLPLIIFNHKELDLVTNLPDIFTFADDYSHDYKNIKYVKVSNEKTGVSTFSLNIDKLKKPKSVYYNSRAEFPLAYKLIEPNGIYCIYVPVLNMPSGRLPNNFRVLASLETGHAMIQESLSHVRFNREKVLMLVLSVIHVFESFRWNKEKLSRAKVYYLTYFVMNIAIALLSRFLLSGIGPIYMILFVVVGVTLGRVFFFNFGFLDSKKKLQYFALWLAAYSSSVYVLTFLEPYTNTVMDVEGVTFTNLVNNILLTGHDNQTISELYYHDVFFPIAYPVGAGLLFVAILLLYSERILLKNEKRKTAIVFQRQLVSSVLLYAVWFTMFVAIYYYVFYFERIYPRNVSTIFEIFDSDNVDHFNRVKEITMHLVANDLMIWQSSKYALVKGDQHYSMDEESAMAFADDKRST